jgi:hypothetical protein
MSLSTLLNEMEEEEQLEAKTFSPEILVEAPPAQAGFVKKEFSFMDETAPQ